METDTVNAMCEAWGRKKKEWVNAVHVLFIGIHPALSNSSSNRKGSRLNLPQLNQTEHSAKPN